MSKDDTPGSFMWEGFLLEKVVPIWQHHCTIQDALQIRLFSKPNSFSILI